ncbi:MAG TPA: Gfo/Idh/MocA family oxidoreductase, partial [Actinoplanes sp.]|nr:Gfo/Idh/MocA family oxidoreductase [Actinoplanes sp.]
VGVVRFENGALGVLHATTAAYPGLSARLQVHGDRGSAVIDNDQLAFFEVTTAGASPEEKLMGTTGSRAVATAGSDPGQLSDAHRLQYLNFLAALDGTEPVRVDLETNRQSIGVITGVYESARTGRPVRLS